MVVEATLFIGAVVAGVTQLIKLLSPKVQGEITIVVAVLVGIVIALIDTSIGITNISVAQGILIGLGTAGVAAVAGQ